MGATGFSVVGRCHNPCVCCREDFFWSTWGSFVCCVPLRLGKAVEHIGEYDNEPRSAIYPQFRCYTHTSDVGTFSFRWPRFICLNKAKNNQNWIFHRKLKVLTSVIFSRSYVKYLLLGAFAAADRDRRSHWFVYCGLGRFTGKQFVFSILCK